MELIESGDAPAGWWPARLEACRVPNQRFVRPAEANPGWMPTGHFEQLEQMTMDYRAARLDIVSR